MRIYKNKDITTSIDTEKMSINNPDTYFYTEDKGSAALRIFINHRKTAFNLDNTNLTPVLDLFHTDGSIWLDEPLEVIMSDKGLLQYNIPDNVISHAGKVKAKLFLKNAEQSVHVANFTFDIKDSGIEGAIEKEISVNLVDDAVRRIINEQPEIFKGEKGDKGDTGPQGIRGPQGLKGDSGSNIPENGSITTEKLAPKAVQKNNLSDDINIHSILSGDLVGPPLVVDFKKGKVTIPAGIRFVNGFGNYSVGAKTLLLSSTTGNMAQILFNYSSGEVTLRDYTPSINFRTDAVVGVISKNRESITVSGEYSVVGKEGRQAFLPFNASLSTSRTNLTIDFTSKKLIVNNVARPYIYFESVGGGIINFQNATGEYSFSDVPDNFYLTYDRKNNKFAFVGHYDLATVDLNYTPVIGLVNKFTEEVFIQGTGYNVIKTEEENNCDSKGVGLSRPYHFLGDPGGSYIPKIEDYYYKASYHKNYENFMAEWEELRNKYPDYIKREQIGTSVQGRAIYRYDFNYYDVMNRVSERPTIYVNNSIHAVETHGVYAVLAFFKDLCDNWLNDEQLGFIHNNLHLIVVPLANPDGFVANTRQNINGVDINRNFTRGWNNKNNEVVGDLTYPGTGPLSEPETQALEGLLEKEVPYYTFDIHNNGSLESKKDLISMSTGPDRLRYFAKAFGNSFDYRMRRKFPEIKDWNTGGVYNLVMDRLSNPGGSLAYSAVELGSNGSTVEFTTGWDPYPPETHQYINKDALGNLILGAMRSTDRL